jgi:hypothetical protein
VYRSFLEAEMQSQVSLRQEKCTWIGAEFWTFLNCSRYTDVFS